ncbi:hypothetical protein [Aquirufa antheringensis]|jgi:hypothetical protein|uniref:hypothetical protein n=1 Tax=Aquirufa antheringensis TaxID=2516559 RepID=UPI0022A812C4|nr:hypothetical protein [Aquirufa antheringensis]MCZ2487123.1 hypothetical protein [Aquirufa antheringensis]MCZ2489895.1 hypothetical protein [Aquirufa antheringensis]
MFDGLLESSISFVLKTEIIPDTIENIIKSEQVQSWVKNAPISSLIISTGNTLVDYKNRILIDKLSIFLQGISELDEDKKIKFEKKYLADKKTKSKFYKDLFITLEKLDEEKKALFLSNLFSSLINDEISKEDFFRFSHIVSNLYIEYLDEFFKPFLLGEYKSYIHPKPDLNIIFETHGLVERTISNERDAITKGNKIQTKYKISQFGLLFKKHCIASK